MSNVMTSSRTESGATTPVERRTLVFFVGTDPAADPGPLRTAQHFASVAAGAGLAAELRVAGRATRSIELVDAPAAGVDLTICPRGMQKYGITDAQADAIGARPRTLAEILTEVAEGRSVLIPVTHTIDDPQEA